MSTLPLASSAVTVTVNDVYPREGTPQYFIASPTKTYNTNAGSITLIPYWTQDPNNPGPQRTFNAREQIWANSCVPYYAIID